MLFPCAHVALMTWGGGKSLHLGGGGLPGGGRWLVGAVLGHFVGDALGSEGSADASEDFVMASVAAVATVGAEHV